MLYAQALPSSDAIITPSVVGCTKASLGVTLTKQDFRSKIWHGITRVREALKEIMI